MKTNHKQHLPHVKAWVAASIVLALIIAVLTAFPSEVYAADASIAIRTDKNEYNVDGNITVSVSISADSRIGTYDVELAYDTDRMLYTGGADDEAAGVISLVGTGTDSQITYSLVFKAVEPGEAGVRVTHALVNASENNTSFSVSAPQLTPVRISGESSGESYESKLALAEYAQKSGLPIIGTVKDTSGQRMYIIDHAQLVPEGLVSWKYKLVNGTFDGMDVSYISDNAGIVKVLALLDESGVYHLYAENGSGELFKVGTYTDLSGAVYALVPVNACSSAPANIRNDADAQKYVVYAIAADGQGGYYNIQDDGTLVQWTERTEVSSLGLISGLLNGINLWIIVAVIIVLVIVIIVIWLIIAASVRKRKKKARIEARRKAREEASVSRSRGRVKEISLDEIPEVLEVVDSDSNGDGVQIEIPEETDNITEKLDMGIEDHDDKNEDVEAADEDPDFRFVDIDNEDWKKEKDLIDMELARNIQAISSGSESEDLAAVESNDMVDKKLEEALATLDTEE